ncbi:hypothetical protein MYX65_03335 [Acidobacteria bacterium AH-259-L09]|nr:hypothetical protein [Acidobacteria bacterium AH-259-L09]
MWRSCCLLTVLLLAATAALAGENPDLVLLKKNTEIFERIVSEILKQNFPNPFALTGEPEGTYLRGYGVVVSFHLNINRSRIRTPFGEIPGRVERPKEEQLRILKDSMLRCLADYGATFKQLTGPNRISISVHVEDRNELDPTKKTTVMVISASQEDVDLFTTKKISLEEFKDKVDVVEY